MCEMFGNWDSLVKVPYEVHQLDIKRIGEWERLIGVVPIWVKYKSADECGWHILYDSRDEGDDKYVISQCSMEDMTITTTTNCGAGYRVKSEELMEAVTFFDYESHADMVIADLKYVDRDKDVMVYDKESGKIGYGTVLNRYHTRVTYYGEPDTSYQLKTESLEFIYYIGFLKYLNDIEDTSVENLIGRWYYTESSFFSSAIRRGSFGYIKRIESGDSQCSIVPSESYLVPGNKNTKVAEADSNRRVSLSALKLLDIVNDEYYGHGNLDDDGFCIKETLVAKDSVIEFHEDTVITTNTVPIIANIEVLTLRGNCTVKLNAGPQQPCIGVPTHTGMSFGRWSPSPVKCTLKEIIVDGINLVLNSKVPAFSVGAYNYESCPKVVCINGGTVSGCPEVEGKRLLIHKAMPPNGSTKISDIPKYIIQKEGISEEDYLEEWQVEFKSWLVENHPKYAKLVNVRTMKGQVNEAKELLSLNSDLDVSVLIKGAYQQNTTQLVNAVVLGMELESSQQSEFRFEADKVAFMLSKYSEYDVESTGEVLGRIRALVHNMHLYKQFDELSKWEQRVVYEMIPAYYFTFKGSWLDSAREFYGLVDVESQKSETSKSKWDKLNEKLK